MAISEGAVERPVRALERGAACTWFEPDGDPHAARKRWISGMKPRGRVTVDAGAVAALGRGKSLLPAGVKAVERRVPAAATRSRWPGRTGRWSAKGLAGYDAGEARVIMGHRSDRIAALLGYAGAGGAGASRRPGDLSAGVGKEIDGERE